jgi:FtsP/CotA-like multicopper oxidase with cupredoxin domain
MSPEGHDPAERRIVHHRALTLYQFEGDCVLHCHILGHEDQGMMEWARIELPK